MQEVTIVNKRGIYICEIIKNSHNDYKWFKTHSDIVAMYAGLHQG